MLRLRVRQAGWSAPAEWVAGAGGLLPGLPAVPLGPSWKCSQGTMRRHASPLARHNRAICTQTTEPAIKANTGEYSAGIGLTGAGHVAWSPLVGGWRVSGRRAWAAGSAAGDRAGDPARWTGRLNACAGRRRG